MKKWNIFIVILMIVVSFTFGAFGEYLYLDTSKYYTNEPLVGTYATSVATPGSNYITFLDNDTVVLYNQSNLYIEGSIINLKDNIYKFAFENEQIYAVYYEDEIILINEENVEKYLKISNVIEFIGINKNSKSP